MPQKEQNDHKQKSKARQLLERLNELEESNKRRNYLLSVVATILATIIAGSATFMITYIESPKKTATSYEVFKESVITSLRTESSSLNNIELLYQGSTSKLKDDPELIVSLRKALVRIHFEITRGNNFAEDKNINRTEWAKKIREIISEIDQVSPYHGLPATERNLIEDINLLHQNSQIKSKLDQLAISISARKDELEKTQSQATWSLILAVAGIAGTVVSVVISISQVFLRRVRDIREMQIQKLRIE